MSAICCEAAPLRAALIAECQAEFTPRLAILLEVARVLGHALRCPQCRPFAEPIAGVFVSVARHVGGMVAGWQVLGIDWNEVAGPQSPEVAALLDACEMATVGDEKPTAAADWRLALNLAGLAIADQFGRNGRHIEVAVWRP